MNATWKVRWDSWSLVLLLLFTSAHPFIVLVAVSYLMPEVWAAQLVAGWLTIFLIFLGRSVSNCFLEWFAHRYMLHTWIVTWLKRFCKNHRKHHGISPIGLKKSEGSDKSKVFSRYFLDEKSDWFNVSFADYTLAAFMLTETALVLPLQLIFPQIPFLLGGYLAVVCSHVLYELIHPLEHRPEEWWGARSSNLFWPVLRSYVSRLRLRHQYHHFNPKYDMAIMGLFGYPLADKVFGTDKLPPDILHDGNLVNETDLIPPQPCQFVIWLDAWAQKREKRFCTEKGY